jgi:hypothetical protein
MVTLLKHSMTATDSDPALMQWVAAGDEDALRALVAAYGQRMYAYALRLSGDPARVGRRICVVDEKDWRG